MDEGLIDTRLFVINILHYFHFYAIHERSMVFEKCNTYDSFKLPDLPTGWTMTASVKENLLPETYGSCLIPYPLSARLLLSCLMHSGVRVYIQWTIGEQRRAFVRVLPWSILYSVVRLGRDTVIVPQELHV